MVTGLCQMLFPNKANGSLLSKDGHVIGSSLIGQNFARPEYFSLAHRRRGPAEKGGKGCCLYRDGMTGKLENGPSVPILPFSP